jgi:drug/metabolite transporter (DMT)-like permease
MKTKTINLNSVFWIGTLLLFPTAYFIFISILKYGFEIPDLFDSSQSLLQNLGIKERPGLNINLLIVFGPAIALLLNLFVVLKFDWQKESECLSIKFSIKKHWWNILVVIFSGILLATLFIYAFGENCRC